MLKDQAQAWVSEQSPVQKFRQMRDSGIEQAFQPEVWPAMVEMGWTGILIPESHGGSDLGYLTFGVVLEELGRQLGARISSFQSNHEGELADWIRDVGATQAGMIVNAAAYTHTSIALRDALLAADVPFVEVHLTNLWAREPFRHHSYFSDLATGVIAGLGAKGYELALLAAMDKLTEQ